MKKQGHKISEIKQRYEEYHRCEGITSLPLVKTTLVRMAGRISKKVCLDIGCGQGGLTALIAERGQFTVGVDISKNAVSWAKKRVGSNHGRTAFIVGDARLLPFSGKLSISFLPPKPLNTYLLFVKD
jgi:ubiquinone/menaquinone biosynthesis C-methylase UbiE